jgi:hypothetical protein
MTAVERLTWPKRGSATPGSRLRPGDRLNAKLSDTFLDCVRICTANAGDDFCTRLRVEEE